MKRYVKVDILVVATDEDGRGDTMFISPTKLWPKINKIMNERGSIKDIGQEVSRLLNYSVKED